MDLFFCEITNVQRSARREAERSAILLLLQEVFAEDIVLMHTENGKPYLPQYPQKHISISHTEGRAMLSISEYAIGIDIEHRSRQMQRVVQRILPEVQYRAISIYGGEIADLLYQIAWTSAEALFKLVEESSLITDFEYYKNTLAIDREQKVFSLQARYKEAPEIPLLIEGSFEGNYIYSVATYLSDAK